MCRCMATWCFAAGRSLLVYNPPWLCPSCWRSLAAAGRLFPFLRRGASSPRHRSFHAPPPPPSVTVEIGGRWGGGRGGRGGEKESVEDGESSCVPCCNMLAAEFCGQHRVYQVATCWLQNSVGSIECIKLSRRTPLEYFYLIRYTLLQPYYIFNWQICKFS